MKQADSVAAVGDGGRPIRYAAIRYATIVMLFSPTEPVFEAGRA